MVYITLSVLLCVCIFVDIISFLTPKLALFNEHKCFSHKLRTVIYSEIMVLSKLMPTFPLTKMALLSFFFFDCLNSVNLWSLVLNSHFVNAFLSLFLQCKAQTKGRVNSLRYRHRLKAWKIL